MAKSWKEYRNRLFPGLERPGKMPTGRNASLRPRQAVLPRRPLRKVRVGWQVWELCQGEDAPVDKRIC